MTGVLAPPGRLDPPRPLVTTVTGRAALAGFVLGLRLTAVVTLVASASLVSADPVRLAAAGGLAAAVTLGQMLVIGRWPALVGRPAAVLAVLAVEVAAAGALFALARTDPVHFLFIGGSAAVAGALLGSRAVPLWAAQTGVGYLVVADLLRSDPVPTPLAVHLTGIPPLFVLAGVAAWSARTGVDRYVALTAAAQVAIERSAVESERGRMARELHDSVAQTLRGLSFAAFALPASIGRRPELAVELADTVAQAARTASEETRQVLDTLRADRLDAPFAEAVAETCRHWSARTGVAVRTRLAPVEVDVDVRHELIRVLREALSNVDRHARAGRVDVAVAPGRRAVVMTVSDDGVGTGGGGVDGDAAIAEFARRGRYGVIGMRERVERVGGHLHLVSEPGRGTRLAVRVPTRRTPG